MVHNVLDVCITQKQIELFANIKIKESKKKMVSVLQKKRKVLNFFLTVSFFVDIFYQLVQVQC